MSHPLFTLQAGNRKPANKLEAHLLTTAQAWCSQELIVYKDTVGVVPVDTLRQFYKALLRECTLYCLDNSRSKPSSVRITLISAPAYPGVYYADHIIVRPSVGDLSSTFTISPQIPS